MRLLSMSGFIPEHICDTVRFTGYNGDVSIAHYCGYAADFISQTIHDSSIDGAVFPHTCDSTRIMKSYLSQCDKFIYQMNVPVRRDNAAIDYFSYVIKDYQSSVEHHFGIKINDVDERCRLINRRNNKLQELYRNLDSFSYSEYINYIHNMLKQPLSLQNTEPNFAEKDSGNKRVFIIGSFLSAVRLAEIIENNGMKIVGDNIPESGRLAFRDNVELSGDIYKEIAKSILTGRQSPTQNDFDRLISDDMREIKEKNADAVIFLSQKYCEPYDYLYSAYKKCLDEHNIPSVKITLTDSEDTKGAELMLETFADMI